MKKKLRSRSWWRWLVAVLFDLADMTIGRIPVFGTLFDLAGSLLSVALWGVPGLLSALELLDVSDQIDGFIPSVTLAGLVQLWREDA